MKLTSRARYTLRAMVELTRLEQGRQSPVRLTEIAKITGISRKYLEQLMMALKRHDLVEGYKGRAGGYRLTRPADQITVGQILDAVTGPVDLAICIDQPQECLRSEFCECRCIWVLLEARINDVLNEYSLADLIKPGGIGPLRALVAQVERHRTDAKVDP